MDTESFIRTLAADHGARDQGVGRSLLIALSFAVPVVAVLFLSTLGMRKDIMEAMHHPFFYLKFAITIALAVSVLAISLHLSRPEASVGRWAWLLAIPLGLLGAGMMGDMMMPQRVSWTARMMGSSSGICVIAIPLMSMPILAATLMALRHGAPARPAVAGAFAGLLSAGIAATLYASHCLDDSPLFLAVWYSLAIGLVTAIGALIGARVLKY